MSTAHAYHQGTRNALIQQLHGGDLGGHMNQSQVMRAFHNAALLWHAAAPEYRRSRMPNLDLTGQVKNEAETIGENYPERPWKKHAKDANLVMLSPHAIRTLAGGKVNPDVLTVLHEWAHAFQSPGTYRAGSATYEGGAEAFARHVIARVLGRMGLDKLSARSEGGEFYAYTSQVRDVMKRLGLNWVLKGQFH